MSAGFESRVRVPALTPVPLRGRRDGWLPSREPDRVTTANDLLWHRMLYGTLRPVMRDGLYLAAVRAPDSHAVESLYRRVTRLQQSMARRLGRKKSQ